MPKPKSPDNPAARRPQTVEELRAEFWASIAEERRLRAEGEKRREEYAARAEKEMAALRRSIDGIGKNTGDFARNTGRILERDVLAKIKHDGGIGPVKGGLLSRPEREETGEYDGVIINGQETVVLEIKRNLLLKDVRKFLDKQLPRFVREFPALARGRKVYGALAFQLDADNGKAVDLARENGLMLVRINSRRKIEVLNPDTAQLRNIAG